ncbi:MAG TPA: patatin-like phospholipase family protein [Cytophagaceae bacterium]|jgi:hypothetical protein|nr:patatin-like phospholipase family protein [Cytophagaceae bacterium]
MVQNLYYSFPVQLLANNIKKNQVLLLIWVLLFGFVTQNIATIMGVPYLFLDPEYLNVTDYKGFFIIGVSIGIFISAYHITTYILDSYRFNFLGTIAHPFANFCLNNSIIPIIFIATYIVSIIKFQFKNGQQKPDEIFIEVLALVSGALITILFLFLYFKFTNKDVFKELAGNLDTKFRKNAINRVNVFRKMKNAKRNKYQVTNYFSLPYFFIKKVPEFNTYNKQMLLKIFDQNHLNAVIVEIFVIIVIITLGLFRDLPFFQIPAAASCILFFSIFVMFTGAFSYWLRGWSVTVLIAALFLFNFLIKNDYINTTYQVSGINYNTSLAEYNIDKLSELSHDSLTSKDIEGTTAILENWKAKFPAGTKPKMIFMCTSGGGQRAAVWTTRTLQYIDSACSGRLMQHTSLMTGASGGLIGAAYFRELYYRKLRGEKINLYDKRYFDNMSKDVLNPIIFSMVVNDIFFRFQKFSDGKYEYLKDRGYAFEQQINKNTENVMNRRVQEYYVPEKRGIIPMIIISPTIINDGRKLFISPQPLSYMSMSSTYEKLKPTQKIKGIEFNRFFKNQDAKNLHFVSALRMSATFPYITPNVDLPSDPTMEIMDAGLSDNFGISNAVRFLHVFQTWIHQNTSGVIFVIIRDSEKDIAIKKHSESSLFQKIITPIGSLYSNWDYFQDFNNDNLIEFTQSWFEGQYDVIEFQYIPRYKYWQKNRIEYTELNNYEKNRATLSWHLTQREKESLHQTILESNNKASLEKLQKLLQ